MRNISGGSNPPGTPFNMKKEDYNRYFNQPLYAIFIKEKALYPNKDNGILGFVENSFYMNYDRYFVRVWEKKDVEPIIRKHFKKYYKPSDYFVVRIRSKKCPVEITFNNLNNPKLKKFAFRNHPFTIKKK